MALPREYEGFEDELNIVAEIVSTSTGIPGSGSVAIWGIKEVLSDFPVQTHTLKKSLARKTLRHLV